jgi:hypothetical protein
VYTILHYHQLAQACLVTAKVGCCPTPFTASTSMGVCIQHSSVSLLLLWPDPSKTLHSTASLLLLWPKLLLGKQNTAMHSQPAAAAAAETKRNPTMQLPYKIHRGRESAIVFSSPHLPATPFQLGALAAYVARYVGVPPQTVSEL